MDSTSDLSSFVAHMHDLMRSLKAKKTSALYHLLVENSKEIEKSPCTLGVKEELSRQKFKKHVLIAQSPGSTDDQNQIQ